MKGSRRPTTTGGKGGKGWDGREKGEGGLPLFWPGKSVGDQPTKSAELEKKRRDEQECAFEIKEFRIRLPEKKQRREKKLEGESCWEDLGCVRNRSGT